ncbi:hypothetical protein BGZ54_003670 [Gamsiella multidivaricata]|nr:hypothetical protein BGZ54_003670 [Gamsiella multidivaricata]
MLKLAPTVSDRAQAANRMILRPRRTKNNNSVDTAPKMFQNIVFSIPELVHLITDHLARRDLTALIRVNCTWNSIWVPYLYESLFFPQCGLFNAYPEISKYGDHVKTLGLSRTRWISARYLLMFTANLQSLRIRFGVLYTSYIEQVTEMVPQLRVLHVILELSLSQPSDCQMASVATLKNLEDSYWYSNANLRIDDILLVFRDCRQLRSLVLERVTIVEELKDVRNEQEP